MMPGIDPAQMAAVQKVSSKIQAEIRLIHADNEIRLKLVPSDPQSADFVSKFIPTFAENIAQQLSTFFGIQGEIIDVTKK